MRALLLTLLTVGLVAGPARSQDAKAPPAMEKAPPAVEQAPPTPAANLDALQPCGARAARYAGAKGFDVVVTRLGRASVANPLRPLTPEVSQVLQVVIAAKPATAYGPDLTALRRGPAPAALEAQLGAPIRWEAALPDLPDPLPIVAEDGTPLASLAFRACIDPPAVAAPPVAARGTRENGNGNGKGNSKGDRKGAGKGTAQGDGNGKPAPRRESAPKAPPGFHVPQGAISE